MSQRMGRKMRNGWKIMVHVYYYETGVQQRMPLYGYEGGTFEEADAYLKEKLGHRKYIRHGFYQLVSLDKIREMKKRIGDQNPQWYILFVQEI